MSSVTKQLPNRPEQIETVKDIKAIQSGSPDQEGQAIESYTHFMREKRDVMSHIMFIYTNKPSYRERERERGREGEREGGRERGRTRGGGERDRVG